MKHLEKLTRKHLGEILLDEGLISKSQHEDAQGEHQRTGVPLGPILVEAGYISDWDLAKSVATQYQLPFVELGSVLSTSDAEEAFSPEEQAQHRFVPLDRLGNTITLAVADMPDIEFLRGIQERTGRTPFLFVTLLSEIQSRLVDGGVSEPEATASATATAIAADPTPDLELIPPNPEEAELSRSLSIFDEEEAPAVAAGGEGDGWQNIFDSGNDSVMKEIDPVD